MSSGFHESKNTLTQDLKAQVSALSQLLPYIYDYAAYQNSAAGRELLSERRSKEALYKSVLSREKLLFLSDEQLRSELRGVFRTLWSLTSAFTNIDARVNTIFEKNSMRDLRLKLYTLLYSDKPLEKRFNAGLSIKELGTSSLTEILCFFDPSRYAIVNKKVIDALEKLDLKEDWKRILGIDSNDNSALAQVNGNTYELAIKFLDVLRRHLSLLLHSDLNFLDLDHFLFYIAEH